MFIYLGMAMLAGFLLANQNPINADLRKIIGSPLLAGSISNFVGAIFLGILSFSISGKVFPDWNFIVSHPIWLWSGGLLGGIYLTSNIFLFAKLGAVQTVIFPILGQILAGSLIDSFGWLGAKQIPMTAVRGLGIVIMISGIMVAVLLPALKTRAKNSDKSSSKSLLVWQFWGIVIGAMSAFQQVINARLGKLLDNPIQASFASFVVGFLAVFIVGMLVDKRLPKRTELKTAKKWNYFGGAMGGLFVLSTVLSVPEIGAGLTIMMGLIGQIIGAMLVQQFGWWKSIKYQINLVQILGVLLMFVGIVLIKFL